jgi:hypothetical protein
MQKINRVGPPSGAASVLTSEIVRLLDLAIPKVGKRKMESLGVRLGYTRNGHKASFGFIPCNSVRMKLMGERLDSISPTL